MAVGADFLVDLEAALQLAFVEFAERAAERPLHARRRHLLAFGEGRRAQRQHCAGERESDEGPMQGTVIGHGARPAHAFAPKTDSEIEFGSGLVFSNIPSSGSTIRKNVK